MTEAPRAASSLKYRTDELPANCFSSLFSNRTTTTWSGLGSATEAGASADVDAAVDDDAAWTVGAPLLFEDEHPPDAEGHSADRADGD